MTESGVCRHWAGHKFINTRNARENADKDVKQPAFNITQNIIPQMLFPVACHLHEVSNVLPTFFIIRLNF